MLDRLVGGVGLRRGRRHPTEVRIGEAVDFWRVEDVVPGQSLRLRAETRLPGDAWLEWEIRDTEFGTDLIQTAWFRPRPGGRIYWYLMLIRIRSYSRMAHRIPPPPKKRFRLWVTALASVQRRWPRSHPLWLLSLLWNSSIVDPFWGPASPRCLDRVLLRR
jgi:hypothetical protein